MACRPSLPLLASLTLTAVACNDDTSTDDISDGCLVCSETVDEEDTVETGDGDGDGESTRRW